MKFRFEVYDQFLALKFRVSMAFKCNCCANCDFKTASKLNRHENTLSHKRKVDPQFALAEEAEKAAAKAAKKLSRHENTPSHKNNN